MTDRAQRSRQDWLLLVGLFCFFFSGAAAFSSFFFSVFSVFSASGSGEAAISNVTGLRGSTFSGSSAGAEVSSASTSSAFSPNAKINPPPRSRTFDHDGLEIVTKKPAGLLMRRKA